MFRILTILSITMAMVLMLHTLGWSDPGQNIQLIAYAELEVNAIDHEGRAITKRIPAKKVVPGTEVIYTIEYHNPTALAAQQLVITNPIPKEMHYQPQSVQGSGATFSVDNGHSFDLPENLYLTDVTGHRYRAEPSQYTHIRWQIIKSVPPQATGRVGFRAILQ